MLEDYADLWLPSLHWEPTPTQAQQFEQLYHLVVAGNQVQNLTRITAPADFWEKHLWDSLRGVLRFGQQQHLKVVDIGTGAGFPGLPIAIAHPTWQLTLVDSTLKKVNFVRATIEALSLPQVKGLQGRAEEMLHQKTYGHQFDLALIRAVGSIDYCLSCALPFLRSGGVAVLYRGQWDGAEATSFAQKHWEKECFTTPLSQSARTVIYVYAP